MRRLLPLFLYRASCDAPCLSSSEAMLASPVIEAMWRGVEPSSLSATEGEAPPRERSVSTSSWFERDTAACSAAAPHEGSGFAP